MKDYSFYGRALKLDKKNEGKYYQERAILHFLDMEYDLSLEDFQKAAELGIKAEKNPYFQILQFSKNSAVLDIKTDFSEEYDKDLLSLYIGYFVVQNRFTDAFKFLADILNDSSDCSLYLKFIQKVYFYAQKSRFKRILGKTPKFETVYLRRIKLFSENYKNFSDTEKRYYRQKINQDFETLEKISKNPEYICLLWSKYFENLNETRYAIKFCRKAADTAKRKNNEAFAFIALSVLRNLYIQNLDFDRAIDISVMLAENKPLPQILADEVNRFRYCSDNLFCGLPPEFEKYKTEKSLIKQIKQRKKIWIKEMTDIVKRSIKRKRK